MSYEYEKRQFSHCVLGVLLLILAMLIGLIIYKDIYTKGEAAGYAKGMAECKGLVEKKIKLKIDAPQTAFNGEWEGSFLLSPLEASKMPNIIILSPNK